MNYKYIEIHLLISELGMRDVTMVFADSIPVRALSVAASIVSRIETLPLGI